MNSPIFRSILAGILLGIGIVSVEAKCEKTCEDTCGEPDVNIPTQGSICKFLSYKDPKSGFDCCIDVRHRPEFYYARGVQRFNTNPEDQFVYVQGTWDLTWAVNYQQALQSKLGIRNKSRWGSPEIIKTTEESIKLGDAVVGKHRHHIGRQLMWIREAWVQINLNNAIGIPGCNRYYLQIGALPFSVGRGIALGDAYAVSSGIVGFYTEDVIDQYAYGIVQHGEIVPCKWSYDFYYEMVRNRSGSYGEVAEAIYTHIPDRKSCPSRGFGSITQIGAVRFNINPFDDNSSCGNLNIQPYLIGAYAPEMKLETYPDAKLLMGTWGVAFDYLKNNFECGAELAFNFGHQTVHTMDRNSIEFVRDSDGFGVYKYSQIYTSDPSVSGAEKAIVTDTNKSIVEKSSDTVVSNGQEIGTTGLYNGVNRIRDGYKNHLSGYMAVTDFGYLFCDNNFKIAASLAYASGDQDPNRRLDTDSLDSETDRNYSGFVGLQEIYAGKQIQSVFVIGSHSISRPLSLPNNDLPPQERFASTVSGFTNLVVAGTGLHWMPQKSCINFTLRGNAIAYWTAVASNKFDLTKNTTLDEKANKFLGLELNAFFDFKLLKKALKVFGVGALFLPGQHYRDIKGKPQNAKEALALEKKINNGVPVDTNLVLGDSQAWAVNVGLEYTF